MMREAIKNMLIMQSRMNEKVNECWLEQEFEWYRAVWIECAELMDQLGYKWWKKQTVDSQQVRLEVVDIWHFGMSALLANGGNLIDLAAAIERDFERNSPKKINDILIATEAVALDALKTKSFSIRLFAQMMDACELSFDGLYRHYVGKNTLNLLRQDHGYQDGSYIKQWDGREDNEHLAELLFDLDATTADFPDQMYAALLKRYEETT